ncbi:hypothetical protein OEZ85_013299 [Tetradesmus obliquus]|uniref:Cation/H+ exchanger transmembrane domain-containing protein n=2 Tax=Tetradesmus obliquus TaxID=3088 RepID=A0ABY8U994_TETOB|nr:hypothetical protein OEZ85_013299 [Tetradesmus obliquus]
MTSAGSSSRRKTAALASLLVLLCLCLVTRAASQDSSSVASPQVISEAEQAAAASPAAPEAGSNSTDLSELEALGGEDSDKPDQTIAQVIDHALAKEFDQETAKAESEKGKTYNATVASDEGKVETVVRISGSGSSSSSGDSSSAGTSAAASDGASGSSSGGSSSSTSGSASGESLPAAAEVPQQIELGVDRIIDSQDNEFVLSSPKEGVATLTLDPQLIQDLTFLFASAAVMGMLFEGIKQPVINGYLVAGAIVGPGGLQLIKELVQVESLAQLGVQLLLFHLGRELSFTKLKSVWSVALLGGSLQIGALMLLGGLVAAAVKSNVPQGIFVGALLSMSSTSVVVKCLEAYHMTGSAYGQITIGTLILQDCSVGLMFALMPAFGAAAGSSGSSSPLANDILSDSAADGGSAVAAANSVRDAALLGAALLLLRVCAKLLVVLAAAVAAARTVLPVLLRLLLRHASKELVQLSLVALCLISAWLCGQLGLSEELGAFIAGAMMSVAERKLVAAGLLLPSSSMSPPMSPRDDHNSDGGGLSPLATANVSAASAYYQGILGAGGAAGGSSVRAGEADPLLKPPPGSASSFGGEGMPHLNIPHVQLQQRGASLHGLAFAASNQHKHSQAGSSYVSDAGAGSLEPATSVCANIESIQNVLTALFVASMGLIMSPVFLLHHATVLLAGTLVVTLVKAAVVTLVVRLFGVPLRLGLAVGLSMAHIGEFSLVLLSMANQLRLLSSQVYMLLLGVTAMSLLTTPFVILAAVNLLIKEGHHQLYISGPRLRLSSAAGDAKLPTTNNHSPDWAVVMVDGQAAHGKTAAPRINKEARQSVHAAGAEPGSRGKRQQRQQPGQQ